MKRIILAIAVFLTPIVCHADVLKDAGVAGGIVVHLNCGDGTATAELKSNDARTIQCQPRLEKGSAYGRIDAGAWAGVDAWATYRGNGFRGGITRSPVAAQLKVNWRTKLPTKPTAVTIAGGKVFVCSADTHTLYALNASSGATVWTFTADGRIGAHPRSTKACSCSGHVTVGSIASAPPTGHCRGVSRISPTD